MIARIVMIVAVLAVIPIGCRRSPDNEDGDSVLRELERIRDRPKHIPSVPTHVAEFADLAISQRTNGVIDSKPLVVGAVLYDVELAPAAVYLYMYIYDEDNDTFGFGVQETRIGEDGVKNMLCEEYPALVYRPPSGVLDLSSVPVHIRNGGERKDEVLWQRYAAGEGMDVARCRKDASYCAETFPPLYVSLPEPNKVDVKVYVYDRAGNKSEPIPLTNGGKVH